MSPDAPVDVDALLDELYALPLEQFVVARTAASKRIKASGDAVGAERVARLAKPTVAAWVVNQVAREHPDEVAALVTLGDELRAATEDRDRARLTALDRLRRERTEALVRTVRDAGEVAGRAVSASVVDRLGETLTAAVMDPDAGQLVRAGRLAQALQHVGFGIVDEGGEPADVVQLRSVATTDGARSGPEPEESAASDGADRAGSRGRGRARRRGDDTSASASGRKSGARAGRTSDTGTGTRAGTGAGGGEGEDSDTGPGDAGPAAADPLAEAERAVEESTAEVDRLEAARDEADARARAASDAVGQVEDDLGRIEDELARLADERDEARARLEDARALQDEAQAALDAADDDLAAAEERAAAARKARRAARRR